MLYLKLLGANNLHILVFFGSEKSKIKRDIQTLLCLNPRIHHYPPVDNEVSCGGVNCNYACHASVCQHTQHTKNTPTIPFIK